MSEDICLVIEIHGVALNRVELITIVRSFIQHMVNHGESA